MSEIPRPETLRPDPPQTSIIIREALVLQGKLVIDGLRDALLIPISFVAALLSLLQTGPERGRLFCEVLRLGRRSERWINLFAAADRLNPDSDSAATVAGLDAYLEEVEARIMTDYRGGGLSRSARDAVDRIMEGIESARRRFGDAGDEERDE